MPRTLTITVNGEPVEALIKDTTWTIPDGVAIENAWGGPILTWAGEVDQRSVKAVRAAVYVMAKRSIPDLTLADFDASVKLVDLFGAYNEANEGEYVPPPEEPDDEESEKAEPPEDPTPAA